jgi:signal transduction histidine kinase/ActR/RegA family two-component response regulator
MGRHAAPALPPILDDITVLKRCFRDIVALSMLPTMWSGAEPRRIAESLASSLFTTLDPALVYVGISPEVGELPIEVAQTGRYQVDPSIAATLGPDVAAWVRIHDPHEPLHVAASPGGAPLNLFTRPVGHDAELGVIAVGYAPTRHFPALHHLVLNVAATQAATAIHSARLLSSLRKSEADLRTANAALQDADRRKDEFLATLSHELRNPLAPLRNSLHVLQLGGNERASPATQTIHAMMGRQVDHLVRLVDDLLEMSRISRGTFELRRERLELSAVVRHALETSGPLLQEAGHRLVVSLPEEPLWVDGDPVRLSQILANLLNNAARYTESGGEVHVTARREDGAAVIGVRDNGIGIAPDALEHIFEMFNRGEQAGRSSQGGLGIGLALARKLAEMHGGEVTAHSDGPGRGSEFLVRIPLAVEPALGGADGTGAAPFGQSRILVVDDKRDAGESLAMILRHLGADVRVATDGLAALDVLGSFEATVVLLDIGMPGIDGYEVARRIRAQFARRRIALVALTGWGQEDDRRRARESGFDHHLTKPVEIATLLALLASLEPVRPVPAA